MTAPVSSTRSMTRSRWATVSRPTLSLIMRREGTILFAKERLISLTKIVEDGHVTVAQTLVRTVAIDDGCVMDIAAEEAVTVIGILTGEQDERVPRLVDHHRRHAQRHVAGDRREHKIFL